MNENIEISQCKYCGSEKLESREHPKPAAIYCHDCNRFIGFIEPPLRSELERCVSYVLVKSLGGTEMLDMFVEARDSVRQVRGLVPMGRTYNVRGWKL